jgi:alpha-tubulin suppressor-like RCC1 family protein
VVSSSGTAKCSGTYNNWGQLGDGTTLDRLSPVDVVGLTGAVQITTGSYHTCARVVGDTIECWGNNQGGQIGIGTMGDTPVPTPVDVSGLTGVLEVSAGGSAHTCARLATGTVWCWGGNHLGDGSGTGSPIPVQTTGITDAVAVEAGGNHSCAALASGRIACWGNNSRGGLGDGTTIDRLTPVDVVGFP